MSNVKKGKVNEVIKRATRNMLEFSKIEGMRYQIKTYLTPVEAMRLINLEMPE